MTHIRNNFIDSIGNTPLIKLKAASEITGCNIYGKAEFMNPGGSVKDRAALALIRDAQEKKLISKGGIIVEGTAGNTGIGLGLLGNSLGYKTIIVMNDNQTQEKKDKLAAFCARFMENTLNRDATLTDGDELPPLWHWLYFLDSEKISRLGRDGHPEKGGFLPPVTLPRRMWAGGRFWFKNPLLLGIDGHKKSTILSVDAVSYTHLTLPTKA